MSVEALDLPQAEVLNQPWFSTRDGVDCTILAVTPGSKDGLNIPFGYTTTRLVSAAIMTKLCGPVIGEWKPSNAVNGYVGDKEVYDKHINTNMPLVGIRTFIAQQRAARAVKRKLK